MTPTKFPEQNGKLVAAPGDEATVLDLPVYRDAQYSISCWQMSWRDRLRLLVTGRVWFWAWARTHPPIYLGAERPDVFPPRPGRMNPLRRWLTQWRIRRATKRAIAAELKRFMARARESDQIPIGYRNHRWESEAR
jgi:hypothetical protein